MVGGVILGIFLAGMISKGTTGGDVIKEAAFGVGLVLYFAAETQVTVFWYPQIGCAGTIFLSWLSSEVFGHRDNRPIDGKN